MLTIRNFSKTAPKDTFYRFPLTVTSDGKGDKCEFMKTEKDKFSLVIAKERKEKKMTRTSSCSQCSPTLALMIEMIKYSKSITKMEFQVHFASGSVFE
jgi:hypothetical protein